MSGWKGLKLLMTLSGFFCLVTLTIYGFLAQNQGQKDRSPDPSLPPLFEVGFSPVQKQKPLPEAARAQFSLEWHHTQNQQEAIDMVHSLKKKGIDAFFTPFHQRGIVYYRVRSGVYADEQGAKESLSQLPKLPSLSAKVVRL